MLTEQDRQEIQSVVRHEIVKVLQHQLIGIIEATASTIREIHVEQKTTEELILQFKKQVEEDPNFQRWLSESIAKKGN